MISASRPRRRPHRGMILRQLPARSSVPVCHVQLHRQSLQVNCVTFLCTVLVLRGDSNWTFSRIDPRLPRMLLYSSDVNFISSSSGRSSRTSWLAPLSGGAAYLFLLHKQCISPFFRGLPNAFFCLCLVDEPVFLDELRAFRNGFVFRRLTNYCTGKYRKAEKSHGNRCPLSSGIWISLCHLSVYGHGLAWQ